MSENNTNSNGVGNFKGVMLCNRPFAGTCILNLIIFLNR